MQISRWGNSLAVRLPKTLVDALSLEPGDEIAIVQATRETLVIEKVDRGANFLQAMEQFRWPAAEDYRFNRDEANER
jgi:antitoxin MazE